MSNLNTTTGTTKRNSIRVLDYDEAPLAGNAKKGETSRDFQIAFIAWLKRRGLYEGSTTQHACMRVAAVNAKRFKNKNKPK